MERRNFLQALAAAGGLASFSGARADSYPNRPVTILVPFAPGGTTDVIARIISEPLGRELGQPVIVDNKGGAGGAVGTLDMLRRPADGYTMLMVSPSITAAVPAMNPKIGYDPVKDLTPIMNIAASSWVIAVNPRFPGHNFKEFLAELKRRPGAYSYGSSGIGGILHLDMELFKSLTGTFVTHIPYRGAGPADADAISGQIPIVADNIASLSGYIRDGRLVPIALAAPRRLKDFPQIATFAEVGLPQLNPMHHFGFVGPKAMPKEAVDRINVGLKRVLQDEVVRKRIESTGAVIVGSTPEEFGKEIKQMFGQLQHVVAERRLSME